MLRHRSAPISLVIVPDQWPPPPRVMSFSSLIDIETCPRRFALSSATYRKLWDRQGYPEKAHLPLILGRITHLALHKIILALSRIDCSSLEDESVIDVIRRLGGYTNILRECGNQICKEIQFNPRSAHLLEFIEDRVSSAIPEIREQLQSTLRSMHPVPRTFTKGIDSRQRFTRGGALGPGLHSEVLLKNPGLKWMAVVDLINLSDSHCEIIDFKTGGPKDVDRFQLQVYSLLWARDIEINPTGRLADKATLAYRDRNIQLEPLSAAELKTLQCEILERTEAALRVLWSYPPNAQPSIVGCCWCDVRHLCGEYWKESTQHLLKRQGTVETPFADLQVRISQQRGPRSWDVYVEVSRAVSTGKTVLLRTTSDEIQLETNDRIRILNCSYTRDNLGESLPTIATIVPLSEIFWLPDSPLR